MGDGASLARRERARRRAARLRIDRGIPFAVYSGHSRERKAPPEFQGVPWLDKPVGRARLQATMAGLVPDLRAEAARR
jgi:hypothetical protein